MDAYEAIVAKRDTRAMLDEPVPEAVLRRVLQAGRMAGSASNTQPIRFLVVTELADRRVLAESWQWAAWLDRAPAVIMVVSKSPSPFDAGRAAQNMLVAAHNDGLASCPVSVGQQVKPHFGIPDEWHIPIVVALGAPDPDAAPVRRENSDRLPFEEYVRWGRWDGSRQPAG